MAGIPGVGGAQVRSVFTGEDESLSRTLKNIEGSATRLDKVLGNLRGRIRTAFEFHVINRSLLLFERGIDAAIDAIPDLIHRGEQWAHTVDRIVDITGMAAEQASELAAVAENVGVNSDGLGRMMNALAKAVTTNADELADYGIRVKDSNGHLLDSFTIFQNVRQRIASMGASLDAARLSQIAFGRAALEAADVLTLTNDEWERQTRLARESGLIMTRAGLQAAEEWERTQNRLQQAINGIGAQILQGVAPALIGLTNGVTRVINQNMDAIVNAVAGTIVAISSMIADLMGIDLAITLPTDQGIADQERRQRRLRNHLQDLTRATRQQTQAQHAGADAIARTAREQARLQAQLAKAQRELERAKEARFFSGNMNPVEIELMEQRQRAEVKAAQERVRDAQKALHHHERTMTQMTGVTAQATDRMGADFARVFGGKGTKGTVIKGLEQTLADAKTFGQGISDAIKDAILGPDQQVMIPFLGKPVEVRSGGLLGGLHNLERAFGKLQPFFDDLLPIATALNDLATKLTPLGLLQEMVGHLQRLVDALPDDVLPSDWKWPWEAGWTPPGAGFSGAGTAGINALASALSRSRVGLSLTDGGTVASTLSNIDSGISSLWGKLDAIETNTAGDGGTGTSITALTSRVSTLETRTDRQGERIDGLAGVTFGSFLGNQALSGRIGNVSDRVDKVSAKVDGVAGVVFGANGNLTLANRIDNKLSQATWNKWFGGSSAIQITSNRVQGQQIAALQRAVFGQNREGPSAAGSSGQASRAAVRTGQNTDRMVVLLEALLKEARRGIGGGSVVSSSRAAAI